MTLKGFVNIAVSVDGFIAAKDGGLDWLNNQPTVDGEDFGFAAFLKTMDVMIMGRSTYDTIVGFGPKAWASYGDLPIFVLTRNADNVKVPDWLPSTVTVRSSSSPEDMWQYLQGKNKKFTRCYVDGGRTIQSFLKAGHVESMTLTRIPILLGDGISLFGSIGDTGSLKLHHTLTKSYENGFVVSKYGVIYENSDEDACQYD
eukprot:CAMPEP_0194217970 /NCGR_PEP_ID=MMETSP0156-20130528/22652_1 /TAXON_ID=33649 /ORGANISM="Thalassionema nitzschioides, Strain L26-B" /LENGTH=200 /DNA_ID=CAMNT_0038947163 /DNA_START=131 /DNA_END=733 /DNA_ORIENTATION=+